MAEPAAKVPAMDQEYNAFLYAAIGADANGSTLSVLSAIARMDLDPWAEAAQLSGLPVHTAVRRLSALIAAMPVKPSVSGEPGVIAERLIKLLPVQNAAAALTRPLNKAFPSLGTQTGRIALFAAMLLISLTLGALWSFRGHQPPALPSHNTAQTTTR